MKKGLLISIFSCSIFFITAQPWMKAPYLHIDSVSDQRINFYQIQAAFKAYEDEHPEIKSSGENEFDEEYDNSGWLQFKRWEEFMEPRVYPTGDLSLPTQAAGNYNAYLDSLSHGFLLRSSPGAATSNSNSGNWTSLGPTLVTSFSSAGVNGRIDFMRFDPINSNTIWVGAHTGGLWKSTNGGTSWLNMTDQLPFIGCYDLAIGNTNTNIMYLATGTTSAEGYGYDVGIRKSTDGGQSWNSSPISIGTSGYAVIRKLKIHPTNDDYLLAATSDGIYRTIDGGATWTQTQTGNFCDVNLMPGNSSVVFAAEEGYNSTRFYRSSNAGLSFTEITAGLPGAISDLLNYKIGVTPANSNYVYLVARDQTNQGFGGIFRSTDGGTTFTTQCDTDAWVRLLYNSDFTCITVNPMDPQDLFIGGFAPYHSSDGGVTWSAVGGGIYLDFHYMDFLPGSSSTIFACCDGGFFKRQNLASPWTYLGNGLQISQMYKMGGIQSNPGWVIAGLQDVGLFQLKNGAWSELYQADGTEVLIDPVDTNTMYLSIQSGGVLKTTDAGANFSFIVSSCCTGINGYSAWVTPLIMHPTHHNTLLIGKSDVYRSTDGGVNWTMLNGMTSPYFYVTAIAYAPSDTNYIYATKFNKFYYSSDGLNFTASLFAFPGSLTSIVVSNTDPLKLWVGMSGYSSGNKVYMSVDGGINWTDYSIGLPNLPINCLAYQDNSNNQIYAGMDVGVYYRNDALTSWQPFFNGLPNVQVRDMEIQYGSQKIRAATFGRGLWESELASVVGIDEYMKSGEQIVIYPNPSNGKFSLNVNHWKTSNGITEAKIYNSVGVMVFHQIINTELTEIDLEQPTGIYFVSLSDSKSRSTKKLVIR